MLPMIFLRGNTARKPSRMRVEETLLKTSPPLNLVQQSTVVSIVMINEVG
jgi:hypothetical protein